MPTVFSANQSSLLVDGEAVDGVQSLAFRVVTEREDIRGIGTDERIEVSFGLRTVNGELIVRSTAPSLDAHLTQRTKFNMVASLKKGQGNDDPKRSVSFDDCYVETKQFTLGASGTAETTYVFTATRVREE
jgi:hypothetical protein